MHSRKARLDVVDEHTCRFYAPQRCFKKHIHCKRIHKMVNFKCPRIVRGLDK
jgi:hypothetical protein